jgi:hypothetical protein
MFLSLMLRMGGLYCNSRRHHVLAEALRQKKSAGKAGHPATE